MYKFKNHKKHPSWLHSKGRSKPLLTFQSSVVRHVTLLPLAAQEAIPKQSIIKGDLAEACKISAKEMEHFMYVISSGIPP